MTTLPDGNVVLRKFTMDAVAAVTAACQDPEIPRWTLLIPAPYCEDDVREWIATHEVSWVTGSAATRAICDAGDGALLGSIGLLGPGGMGRSKSIEAVYWMATSALRFVTARALGPVGSEGVQLDKVAGNIASERVAAKAGFHFVEEIPDYVSPRAPEKDYNCRRWVSRTSSNPGGPEQLGIGSPRHRTK